MFAANFHDLIAGANPIHHLEEWAVVAVWRDRFPDFDSQYGADTMRHGTMRVLMVIGLLSVATSAARAERKSGCAGCGSEPVVIHGEGSCPAGPVVKRSIGCKACATCGVPLFGGISAGGCRSISGLGLGNCSVGGGCGTASAGCGSSGCGNAGCGTCGGGHGLGGHGGLFGKNPCPLPTYAKPVPARINNCAPFTYLNR